MCCERMTTAAVRVRRVGRSGGTAEERAAASALRRRGSATPIATGDPRELEASRRRLRADRDPSPPTLERFLV
jgi:hypothetical protein